MPRRVGLLVSRAVARATIDAVDDLWSDPAQLEDLPKALKEVEPFRRQIVKARRDRTIRAAWEGTVPKRDGLTRTGHFIYPVERIYYQALVDSILIRTEAAMAPRTRVFGYRGTNLRSSSTPYGKRPIEQWLQFQKAVKEAAGSGRFDAVVITDIAAFFEMISHDKLEHELTMAGVPSSTAGEIKRALGTLMSGARGIPQGSDTSSALASAFLSSVDHSMLRAGHEYFRYVDDFRIFVANEAEGRRALRQLESAVRGLGLSLQPGKTEILAGSASITERIVKADAEIDGIDYVWRSKPRRVALPKVKKAWRSESRRKAWNKRLIKFLANRLRKAKDDLAVNWCLRRLGELDWLAELVAPYLALFADRRKVQAAIETHLRSGSNNSAWEAALLLRAALSARTVSRGLLDYAVEVVVDRNAALPERQWAAVLLGKAGSAADRVAVSRYANDHELLARAAVVALQADPALRAVTYASIITQFPGLKTLADRYKGRARPLWPVFPTW